MAVSMTAEQLKYQHDAIRSDQARYDQVLVKVGERARAPVIGESRNDYRREQLRDLKMRYLQHHPFFKVNMRGLKADALDALESQVLDAVVQEYWNSLNVPRGEIQERRKFDEFGRLESINFLGQESFVKFMGLPGRRVTGWRTDQGRVRANGSYW
jgi:hypothetical protein